VRKLLKGNHINDLARFRGGGIVSPCDTTLRTPLVDPTDNTRPLLPPATDALNSSSPAEFSV
jgi:hypothetical protein